MAHVLDQKRDGGSVFTDEIFNESDCVPLFGFAEPLPVLLRCSRQALMCDLQRFVSLASAQDQIGMPTFFLTEGISNIQLLQDINPKRLSLTLVCPEPTPDNRTSFDRLALRRKLIFSFARQGLILSKSAR